MNPFDNQPDNDAEGFDLDHVLDDAFASRRLPVLSPSMMDVRRRARHRRNRTRATGLAAVTCVSVGGVAVLANNRKPSSRPAAGADVPFGDDPCAPTQVTWELVPTTTLLAPETSSSTAPTTPTTAPAAAASAGFLAAATSTTASDVVTTTTTCVPQPLSGFRCMGDPTVGQDGWTYYDYCEPVDPLPMPTYFDTMLPLPTTTVLGEESVYTVVFGDYLFDIAKRFCTTAETVAEYNGWPEGVEHPLNPGDMVLIPPGPCAPPAFDPSFTTTTVEIGGATGEQVDPSIFTTTELPATTTTVGP